MPSPRPAKRQKQSHWGTDTFGGHDRPQMTTTDVGVGDGPANVAPADAPAAASKPKRVRTGCLTCRSRHLKCDEATPICQNCRKSNRTCERGWRLNFIDTQVQAPPVVPQTMEWKVKFLDESRDIASEYKGGLSRYAPLERLQLDHMSPSVALAYTQNVAPQASMNHQALPPIQFNEPYPQEPAPVLFEQAPDHRHHHSHSTAGTDYSGPTLQTSSNSSYGNPDQALTPSEDEVNYLSDPEEVLFIQVFIEEVGLWMDSMDPHKHFSRLLPFQALRDPMLRNAFFACGARHLTLVNPTYSEEKALHYYDTATRWLLRALQDPNRNTDVCATTAVILNVYEIMCERALQRMNHIAGARALIKECGWNARSTGIGAACFWLNVGMEILSCLHFNWQVAWNPEDWGLDMDFRSEVDPGKEEVWTHRMLFLIAKICNFRAATPRFQEASPRNEQLRLQNRYDEWKRLRSWTEAWNDQVPRTMQPLAYLQPYQNSSKSAFPEVYIVKRTTVIARLFYHTAMCLLAQTNPVGDPEDGDMGQLQQYHSHMICGIVAHVKDRGVASVALRSLAIAGECLTDRREQEEVLQIVTKVKKETGWRVDFMHRELPQKWGWDQEPSPQQQHQQPPPAPPTAPMMNALQPPPQQYDYQPAAATAPRSQARTAFAPGSLNPLLATADFSMPQHPYQQYYVAPNPLAAQRLSTQLPNLTHYPFG